ncbi:MAG TPA: TRAP transporter substrate-binding protein [Burkholderiaceae bacterium]|nr:TRAP transporter substrate-binding protein [Burkholderiaceae bacterium]
MQRRSFIRNATAGAAVAAISAPAIAQAPQIRWRLSSSFPKSLDTIFGAADVFSKKVSEATSGRFQISTHAAGEITPPFAVVDAIQQGTIECAHTAPYYFFGKDPTFAMDCAIPFGMNARQLTAWMYEGNGMKLFREFYKPYNIYNLPMGNTGAQMGGWYRKEIKTVDDIKGLKMRIGGFGGSVLAKIGGVPQNIPGGEVYPALEKGTIDATEWVGPYDDEKLGFNKIAKFYYYPGWWEGGPQLDLYINQGAWDKLPKDYQAIVEAAAGLAHGDMLAKYDAKNPAALRRLVGSGTQLRAFPRPIMDAAWKAANETYAELNASNARWKPIYEDYVRFRDDQIRWFRVTENSFDDFMASVIIK